MKIAWYGAKAGAHATMFFSGAIAYSELGEKTFWLAVLVMIIFGFARETKWSDGYWAKHNKGNE